MRTLAILVVILSSAVASAQDVPYHFRGLRALKCSFPDVVHARWEAGAVQLELDTQAVEIYIDSINIQAETARLIQEPSSIELTVHRGAAGLNFIENTSHNDLNLTTVFVEDLLGDRDKFAAVHSRHVAIGTSGNIGEFEYVEVFPTPSQSYGECVEWEQELAQPF